MKNKQGIKEIRKQRSGTLSKNRCKNVHQLAGFSGQTPALFLQDRSTSTIDQPEPISRFLGFLSTRLHAQKEILFAYRLIRFDVIGTHRARGSDKLSYVFEIARCLRKPPHEISRLLRKQKRTFLQIVRSIIRQFLFFSISSIQTPFVSDFDIRISDFASYDYT